MHNGLIVVSFALTDCPPGAGGLAVVPGTHKGNLSWPEGASRNPATCAENLCDLSLPFLDLPLRFTAFSLRFFDSSVHFHCLQAGVREADGVQRRRRGHLHVKKTRRLPY